MAAEWEPQRAERWGPEKARGLALVKEPEKELARAATMGLGLA